MEMWVKLMLLICCITPLLTESGSERKQDMWLEW